MSSKYSKTDCLEALREVKDRLDNPTIKEYQELDISLNRHDSKEV
jgi:hypothetical protein